jgi:hypothetical protein
MDFTTFKHSLNLPQPPTELSPLLRALWHDAKGHWERAHEIAQGTDSAAAAHLHAYLHRKEGDEPNARYWYRRAGQPFPELSLDEEWESMLRTFLNSEDT